MHRNKLHSDTCFVRAASHDRSLDVYVSEKMLAARLNQPAQPAITVAPLTAADRLFFEAGQPIGLIYLGRKYVGYRRSNRLRNILIKRGPVTRGGM